MPEPEGSPALDPAREEVLIVRTKNGWTIQNSSVVYPADADGKPFQNPPRNMLLALTSNQVAYFVIRWASQQQASAAMDHPIPNPSFSFQD